MISPNRLTSDFLFKINLDSGPKLFDIQNDTFNVYCFGKELYTVQQLTTPYFLYNHSQCHSSQN